MKNNIYGVIGLECRNGNWNADFDKHPKTDGNGNIKGSPYALQYCIKRLWQSKGKKVLGLKGVDDKTGKIFTQEGKFCSMFKFNKDTLLTDLFECVDVKNFGSVFAVKKMNIGIQGVVQIQDGLNRYEDTNIITETILSPFVNSNKDENSMTTNGERILIDEAHYIYPFTVTPNQLELMNVEYTEEDYNDFKETSLKAVTLYNSKAKAGCKNEFGLFVKVKEEYNYLLALGDLSQYITVNKEDDKIVYNLSKLSELLIDNKEKIESIEIYYNPYLLKIDGLNNDLELSKFNIITWREL